MAIYVTVFLDFQNISYTLMEFVYQAIYLVHMFSYAGI